MQPKSPNPFLPDQFTVVLSPAERVRACVLIAEPDANERNNMRIALKTLGYGSFTDVPNHLMALEKLTERKVTHVLFDAKKTNMPPKDFLHKVLENDISIVAIPCSYDPQIDDVFDMLIMGARGYLVKPFTTESLDIAIVMASKGEPISDLVLNAQDRNEALIAILMSSLDKAATILRQSYQFETAKREIPRAMNSIRRSADLAKTFCKGGDQGLIDALERFCIERSKGPATRLGRLRRRLQSTRSDQDEALEAQKEEPHGQK